MSCRRREHDGCTNKSVRHQATSWSLFQASLLIVLVRRSCGRSLVCVCCHKSPWLSVINAPKFFCMPPMLLMEQSNIINIIGWRYVNSVYDFKLSNARVWWIKKHVDNLCWPPARLSNSDWVCVLAPPLMAAQVDSFFIFKVHFLNFREEALQPKHLVSHFRLVAMGISAFFYSPKKKKFTFSVFFLCFI